MPAEVRTTVRLEGLESALPVGLALVKVRVKYWTSSIFQTETIIAACTASPSGRGFAFLPSLDGGGRGVADFWSEMTTSTHTSCTVVRARFDLLSLGREGLKGAGLAFGVVCADSSVASAAPSTSPPVSPHACFQMESRKSWQN